MQTMILAVEPKPETIDFITFMLSIAGVIILLLLSVLGFFLARVISDVKNNSTDIGKNKGQIELVAQQQRNDTKRIEETTQSEIRNMSKNVSELSNHVRTLVTTLAKKGIDNPSKSDDEN